MKKLLLLSFFGFALIAQAQTPMITEWEFTDTTQTELATKGTADYSIKDASNQIVSTGTLTEGANTISVPATGVFTMEISNSSNFAFFGLNFELDDQFPKEMKKLIQWGDIDLNPNLEGMFAYSGIQITAIDTPEFKSNTNLDQMFSHASSFTSDLSDWDVSNVTSMQGMFFYATSFVGDLSGWDVSNVTDMTGLFAQAFAFTSDLSGWDVSNVIDMSFIFRDAPSFKSDLSGWDVSKVTGMTGMFMGASSFTSDLSGWDVSNVTDMGSMFFNASAFTSDLSGWDVSKVTDMNYMFYHVSSFTSDLSGWDVSKVNDMQRMFYNAGMTCNDYSRTLRGWADQNVKSNIELGANSVFYGPAAVDARDFLISNKGWTITGDIYNPNCVLGVNDMELISDIKVINPVKERIQLITKEKIDRVTVYDVSGKKVKEFTGTSVSGEGLPKGLYFLVIQTEKSTKSIKIVKE